MKFSQIARIHFFVSFILVFACFIWLGVTNTGNPVGRRGTLVTYPIPAYWLLIGVGQMFVGVAITCLRYGGPAYVLGKRIRQGSRADWIVRCIPGCIGLVLIAWGITSLLRA